MHGPQDPTGRPTPAPATGRRRLVAALPGPARLALLVAALLIAFVGTALLLPRPATSPAAAQRPPAAQAPVMATAPAPPTAPRASGTAVLRSRQTSPTPQRSRTSPRPTRSPKAPAARRSEPPPGRAGAGADTAAPSGVAGLENQVTALVNKERAKAGCGDVTTDAKLRTAARRHSLDMASNDYFSHDGQNGSSPWDRAKNAGYANPIGENIAKGQRTAAEVMDAWMNSDGHRRNILNCTAREIGVGVAYDGSSPVWTQLFGAG